MAAYSVISKNRSNLLCLIQISSICPYIGSYSTRSHSNKGVFDPVVIETDIKQETILEEEEALKWRKTLKRGL